MRKTDSLDYARRKAIEKATETGMPYLIIRTKRNRWAFVKFLGYEKTKRFKGYTELIYPEEKC